ncbi:MAG: carbohydrate ABC transporter permease, partial [Methanocella sp.]
MTLQSGRQAGRRRFSREEYVKHGVLALGIAVMIFPFLWMLATSFKQGAEIFELSLIPRQPVLDNFRRLLAGSDYLRWYVNSALVAVVVTASELFFDSLAGYALAKLHFPGRTLILFVILSTIMIPTEMLIIPWFMMFTRLHWVDTYLALIVPG